MPERFKVVFTMQGAIQVLGFRLVLITNRKSHMGFQLVPKSVTLNDQMCSISQQLYYCVCITLSLSLNLS